LTKAQREKIRQMFDGRCAYCGEPLSDRWHADHVEAVNRKMTYIHGRGFVPTGELWRPENDRVENLMPSCPPCNIDKHAMPLESWRQKLARSTDVLAKNYPTYRHAKRFGLVAETGATVTFHFERLAKETNNG
jgi:5-methylcytosine-specific restriction endonuclease McrA